MRVTAERAPRISAAHPSVDCIEYDILDQTVQVQFDVMTNLYIWGLSSGPWGAASTQSEAHYNASDFVMGWTP